MVHLNSGIYLPVLSIQVIIYSLVKHQSIKFIIRCNYNAIMTYLLSFIDYNQGQGSCLSSTIISFCTPK